jgi:lipoprotein-releasing system ATP-binding protein
MESLPLKPVSHSEVRMTVLKAAQISKSFKNPINVSVLKNISLAIKAGETIAITGKSGEGKTTLLHILGTLEPPTEGTLEICGLESTASNWSKLRNQYIGFIFQTYNLLEDYTALDNVLMPAKIGGQDVGPGSLSHKRALELLEEVGLSHRANFPAKLLSGGEKQRAAIARAFLNNPALILADEPSGNLDHANSTIIYNLLLGAAQKRGKALIVVTHDRELAALCKKTYSLMDGELQ